MRRDDICLYLGRADRAQLHALLIGRNSPRKVIWRAKIVLSTADDHGTNEIMRRAATSPTAWRWQERYLEEGVAGLRRDKTRPSRVPPLPREMRLKVIAKAVQESPRNATHWSRSTMAEAVGNSPSSVGQLWAEAGLKPHVTRGFKVSNASMFEEKVTADGEKEPRPQGAAQAPEPRDPLAQPVERERDPESLRTAGRGQRSLRH